MKILYYLLLPLSLICVSCEGVFEADVEEQPVFQNIEVPFVTIAKSRLSNAIETFNLVIRSEVEYQNIYGAPSNNFDFEKQMMIGCYLGRIPNLGSDYEIKRVTEREFDVLVEVELIPCSICARSFSSPFHLITINKTYKDFEFERI